MDAPVGDGSYGSIYELAAGAGSSKYQAPNHKKSEFTERSLPAAGQSFSMRHTHARRQNRRSNKELRTLGRVVSAIVKQRCRHDGL
jgi:hypothetical protein